MTTFTIKVIAIISMLIDHTGAVFNLHDGFRIVGRIAFPLFVFLISEGCKHTKSYEKYLLRLGLFALISQIPFDLAFSQRWGYQIHIDFFNRTNIFYTLWLGVVCAYLFNIFRFFIREKLLLSNIPDFTSLNSLSSNSKSSNSLSSSSMSLNSMKSIFMNLTFTKIIKSFFAFILLVVLPLPAAMFAADWLDSDYGAVGVLFIFLMTLFNRPENRPESSYKNLENSSEYSKTVQLSIKLFIITLFMFILYSQRPDMFIGSLFALPIVFFANGQQGKPVKWLFYITYPGHLLILTFLARLLFHP